MSRRARVIGVGQPLAGDDAAGLQVAWSLRARRLPEWVEVLDVAEPSGLLSLLVWDGRTVIVDAVLGRPAGSLVQLSAEELADSAARASFPHGLDVGQAVRLSRALAPAGVRRAVRFVGIGIGDHPPVRGSALVSPPVEAAVRSAADLIERLVREWP